VLHKTAHGPDRFPAAYLLKKRNFDERVKKPNQHFFERQSKKLHRQGARIPRNEAYLWYAKGSREEGERSIWTFYEAVNFRCMAVRLPSFRKDGGSFRLAEGERPNRFASDQHDRHGLFQYRGLHRTGDGLFSQVPPGL